MSAFSEYLQELIQNRGMSISQLSKDSGVERTAIHKALAGERVLPYHAVELLARHLKLSPRESRRFRVCYNQLFESENERRARVVIDRVFLRLSGLDVSPKGHLRECRPWPLEEKNLYQGHSDIARLLSFLVAEELRQEAPRMELTVPAEMPVMEECIEKIYRDRIDMAISRIVCFEAAAKLEECNPHNLECLDSVLAGCLLSDQRYHIYYYYDNIAQTRYADPFPYFLVTHAGVACFSENCQTAIFLRGAEQVRYFHACFRHFKQSCHRLVEYMEDPAAILRSCNGLEAEEGCCAMMAQPCLVKARAKKLVTLFTRKGILDFLETGRLYDPSGGVTEIPDRAERLETLRQLFAVGGEERGSGKILNDMLFPFPEGFAVFLFLSQGIFLCDREGRWGIRIRERGLSRALYDWCVHLSRSENVFGEEVMCEMAAEFLQPGPALKTGQTGTGSITGQ